MGWLWIEGVWIYILRRKLPYESFDCVFFKDQNEGIGVYE